MSKPRPLSNVMPKATNKVLGKKGMLFGKLVSSWPDIVGKDVASKAIPLEIKFTGSQINKSNQANLHLSITGAFAPELEAQKPQLIERLNAFFGYKAILDLKFIHQDIKDRLPQKKQKKSENIPLSEPEKRGIEESVQKIEENELQTALKSLGQAILSRQKQNKNVKTSAEE